MAEPVRTTDSGIVQRTTTYAPLEMLKRAMPVIVTDKIMTPIKMPRNKGDNITMRRLNAFDAATTPLIEGVTPSGRKITTVDIIVKLRQYGDYVRFTDQIVDFHEDNVPSMITEENGVNVGRTVEALNYGVLKAGTTVFYANGNSRSVVNTAVSYNKLHKVVRFLQAMKAERFRGVLAPSPNYATKAIEASWIALAHTDLEHDLRALPGFIPAASYGTRTLIDETEIGAVENIRFLLSPDLAPWADAGGAAGSMVSTTGTLADVYPIIIAGQNAAQTVALRGNGGSPITVTSQMPSKASDSDPLGQRGFQGWKMYHAAKITNESWMARLEVAVSAL